MKKITTLFLLVLSLLFNAQVTHISMPAGYFYNVSNSFIEGGAEIYYQDGNYLYGITQKLTPGSTSSYDTYVYRYDTVSNTTFVYPQTLGSGSAPEHFTTYNGKIYFNYQNSIYRINNANNTITLLVNGCTNFFIKNDNIYAFGGSQFRKYNLSTNTLTVLSYIENTQTINYYMQQFVHKGTDTYLVGYTYNTATSSSSLKFFKMDNNGNIFMINNLNSSYYYIGGSHFTSYNYSDNLVLLNNKIVMYNYTTGSLSTFDTNTNVFEESFYATSFQPISQFVNNGWLYFLDNNNVIHKTDGTTASQAGLPSFYNSYAGEDYEPVVPYNGNYYGYYNGSIYKSDLTFDNTFSINSTYGLQRAKVVSGNLLFFYGNSIKKYNGTTFSNFANLEENSELVYPVNYSNRTYLIGNNLFFTGYKNNGNYYDFGIYKVNTSSLSTQETSKPTLKLYPNPTKSTLNFSEELTDIKIIDMGGKQVSATQSKTKTISVEKLPKGNYLITGKNKNDKTISEKFIKE